MRRSDDRSVAFVGADVQPRLARMAGILPLVTIFTTIVLTMFTAESVRTASAQGASRAAPAARATRATTPRVSTAAATRAVAAMQTVDTWLVARYRGVQLLPDSIVEGAEIVGSDRADDRAVAPGNSVTDAAYARVESVIAAALTDSLLALQFGAQTARAPLTRGATVRLSGPTGAISTTTARIVARRAFRVPNTPGATRLTDSAWRYGWAYVAVVPRAGRAVAGGGFRSWLLLEVGDSVRTR